MTTSGEPEAEAIQVTSVAGAVGGNVACALRAFLAYFLKLGTFGFRGPIALLGYMQRDLVEERRWISKQDYIEGLALASARPRASRGKRARHAARLPENN